MHSPGYCCLNIDLQPLVRHTTESKTDLQVAIQKPGTTNRKQYKYDKVFGPESNQEQVYEDTKALIRSVLDGVYLHLVVVTYLHHVQCCQEVLIMLHTTNKVTLYGCTAQTAHLGKSYLLCRCH